MDLGFNLAQSNRDLKDPTSRQNFGDTSGLLCKNDLIPCLNLICPFYFSLLNNCNCCFLQRTLSQRCWELPRVQLHRQGFEKHPENQFSKNRQFHSFQPMIEFLSCIHIHSEGEDLNEISKTKSIRMVSTLCGMSSTDK